MLNKTMSNMLCCFGIHRHDGSQDTHSSRKVPLSKDTPISMSIHGASVPHAIDSPDALHNIFASNSSVRGYNAVQHPVPRRHMPHGSLNLDFQFGLESPDGKPRGRLEQFTSHVKQKLSESRLDKSSESTNHPTINTVAPSVAHLAGELLPNTPLLSHSQKSVGLTELLASRAASEGGYDSDAKSIQTPTILSTTRALRVTPEVAHKSLATIEGSQIEELPISLEEADRLTTKISSTSKTGVSKSSPLPETPIKISFSDALQLGPNESPSNVLHRLSRSIADGTIRMPDTPELRAMHMPSLGQIHHEWSLSVPVPQAVPTPTDKEYCTNLEQKGYTADATLRVLADRIQLAKHESTESCNADSLFMGLDPTLVEYIEKFATSALPSENIGMSSPLTAIKVCSRRVSDSVAETRKLTSLSELVPKKLSGPDLVSVGSSDAQSVHLFNMRISQRLASNSRAPVLSSTTASSNTSSKSLVPKPALNSLERSRTSSLGRVPTFIAFESNRRPSDPETKRLFEPTNRTQSLATRKRSFSHGDGTSRRDSSQQSYSLAREGSSYYGSSLEDLKIIKDEISPPIRSSSIRNVNSLAVGGRSASGPAVSKQVDILASKDLDVRCNTHMSKIPQYLLSRSAGFGHEPQHRLLGQQDIVPKPKRFIKIDTTPTPIARRHHNCTEADEKMSEIGIDQVNQGFRNSRVSTSTQALEDRRNENLSDIDPKLIDFKSLTIDAPDENGEAWLSQGRRCGWGFHFKDRTPKKLRCGSHLDGKEDGKRHGQTQSDQDNTCDLWHRAFQRLGEPHDRGRLLSTPQFDREGRRKSSVQSVNDQGQSTDRRGSSPATQRRSRSADISRTDLGHNLETAAKRRGSVPMLAAPLSTNVGNDTNTSLKRGRLQKSKFREQASVFNTSQQLSNTGKFSSLRDALGIWGSFPSHTREQRNGPAGSEDHIKVRDFKASIGDPSEQFMSTPGGTSKSSLGLRSRKSWNLIAIAKPKLKRQNTKSMSFVMSSTERMRKRNKGLVGRLKKLYRTKSSELHAYAITQGHRSSVSTGMSVEYPELESLPGEGAGISSQLRRGLPGSSVDGTLDNDSSPSLGTISEVTSKRSKSMHSHTMPWSKRDAEQWSKMYQDCVGSYSALKSSDEAGQPIPDGAASDGKRMLSLTSVLRDSTVNFEAELKRDTDQAKQHLLRQLHSREDSEGGPRMPGSFV